MITFYCEDGGVIETVGLRLVHAEIGETMEFEDDEGVSRVGHRVDIVPAPPRTRGFACVTRQFRKFDPDLKKHNPNGDGVIESRRDYEDVIARKRDKGENWHLE